MLLSRIMRPNLRPLIVALAFACGISSAFAQVNVLTNKNNNSRTGQNSLETLLTLSNVNSNQFGKLFEFPVDGYVQAQPLYLSSIPVNGTNHNVVFVATQHDSVYAIDADNGSLLWQVSFINPAAGITTVPMNVQGCGNITKFNEVGILSTPVIDGLTGTLYVVAKTSETTGTITNYYFRLHALDVTTGLEKFGAPVIISASSGTLSLNSKAELQRPALLLSKGTLYIAFGSNGCDITGRGWLLAYSASPTLLQQAALVTQPDNTYGSAIWQGGVGPAADVAGNVYISTANGLFDLSGSFPDLGDSVVKLNLANSVFNIADYFTPFDQDSLSSSDLDLGSAAVTILPDQPTGPHKHLMVMGSKRGDIYLLNRDSLGLYNLTDNNQIPQYLPGALAKYDFGSPLYWNNGSSQLVYFLAHQDYLKAFSFSNGALSTSPVAQTGAKLTTVGLPAISSSGTTNGIVWLVRNINNVPLLSAYDATHLNLLYDSGMAAAGRDTLGTVAHFATPSIVNGKVFAGTLNELVVYGLFPEINVTAGNSQSGSAGSTLPTPLTVVAKNPYTGVPVAGLGVTFSDGGKKGTFGNGNAVTDSNGQASTTYTLPVKPQTLTITATSAGYSTATFTEQDTVGAVSALSVVSGGQQTGTVATTLPLPLVFKAKDAVGNVVPGASVSFTDNNGGTFSPNPAITGSNGQATTTYTLPTVAKSLAATASVGSVSVNASEKSVPGPPAQIIKIQGDNQTAHKNNKLPKMLIVALVDQYNNGISGLTVTFTDNGAGGLFTNPNPVTNSSGQASTGYTTPGQLVTVTIDALYGTLPPAVFTVTVD